MFKVLRALLLAGVIGWASAGAAEDAKAEKADKDAKEAEAVEINDETTVTVVVKGPKFFHLEDCKELKKTKHETKQMAMGEAKKEKYRPCQQCVAKALKKQEKKAKEEAKAAKKHKKEEGKDKDKDKDAGAADAAE